MFWCYKEAITFDELVEKKTLATVFAGTTVDTATQEALYDWFKYRRLCDDDESKFLTYFRRNLNNKYPMYLDQIRIATISGNMDPFVTHYMEKLGTREEVRNAQNTVSKNGTSSQTNTRTGSGTENTVRTPDLARGTTHNGTESASGTENLNTSRTPDLTDTRTQGGRDITERTGETSVENSSTRTSDRNASNEATSTAFNDGYSIAYPEANMDEESGMGVDLNGKIDGTASTVVNYVNTESYTAGKKSDNSSSTENTNDEESGNETRTDSSSDTTTYGRTDTNRTTGTEIGTSAKETSSNGTNNFTENSTETGTETIAKSTGSNATENVQGSTNDTEEGTSSEKNNAVDGSKEKGRSESVADLLPRAIAAIQGCNPFAWLVGEMNVCFDSYD